MCAFAPSLLHGIHTYVGLKGGVTAFPRSHQHKELAESHLARSQPPRPAWRECRSASCGCTWGCIVRACVLLFECRRYGGVRQRVSSCCPVPHFCKHIQGRERSRYSTVVPRGAHSEGVGVLYGSFSCWLGLGRSCRRGRRKSGRPRCWLRHVRKRRTLAWEPQQPFTDGRVGGVGGNDITWWGSQSRPHISPSGM